LSIASLNIGLQLLYVPPAATCVAKGVLLL